MSAHRQKVGITTLVLCCIGSNMYVQPGRRGLSSRKGFDPRRSLSGARRHHQDCSRARRRHDPPWVRVFASENSPSLRAESLLSDTVSCPRMRNLRAKSRWQALPLLDRLLRLSTPLETRPRHAPSVSGQTVPLRTASQYCYAALKIGVPVVPGTPGPVESWTEADAFIKEYGFPGKLCSFS